MKIVAYCIDRRIYLNLFKSTQNAAGLKVLKPAANGRYLRINVSLSVAACSQNKKSASGTKPYIVVFVVVASTVYRIISVDQQR